MPPRSIVDRLVSRYFNDLDMATDIVHRGKFVREDESFWQAPHAASVMGLGQLFAIMCLSSQFQQLVLGPNTPSPSIMFPGQDNELAIATFQAKSVECLILGHYTDGGPYVLETLILYFMSENFPLKEIDVCIWMLVGTIVQIAMHMGYHRDTVHFPKSITPFAGMPRLVSQANTSEPRNLADSDFDESTAELPPSRPQTEVTPILYTLAKLRILSVALHKKFLVPSFSGQQYAYSRSTCLTAAMKILEFQHLIDEETRPDGRLYQIRWRVSTAVTQEFLLATSVLCLYLQTRAQNHEQHPHPQQRYSLEDAEVALQDRIRQLLQTSLDVWLRLSLDSTEARRAAEALRYVLRETEPFALESTIPGPSLAQLDFQGFVEPMPNYNPAGIENEGMEGRASWADLVHDPNDVAPWAGGMAPQHMGLFSL
ncbi:fungal-specific transcription factor domain protein [Diaporthe eres]|nr:fungal-specific transcription factor domain protein [Diaporthe eres]